MDIVKDKIKEKFDELTKSQKTLARFILKDKKAVVLHTAKELGKLANISESTVIRFCYAIGYEGYASFQEEIRNDLLATKERDTFNRFEKISDTATDLNEIALTEMTQDLHYIQKTLEEFDNSLYSKIITAIVEAKRIVVIGLRTSYAPAYWLSYTLNVVKGNTTLYRGEIDDANYILSEIDENSLVIAFSFPRYTRETLSFVRAAKSKGAKILAFTDDDLSPIGRDTDFLIKVTTPEPISIKGLPTIFSILKLFVTGVMNQDKENVHKNFSKYRETSNLFNAFAGTKDAREEEKPD